MSISKEIQKAFLYQTTLDKNSEMLTPEREQEMRSLVENAFESGNYDFSKYSTLILRKSGKARYIKRYEDPYAPETVLCQCVKQIVDRVCKVRYPNRNKTIQRLFDILPAVVQMLDFTIVKFDFKDYFNSVSAVFVYEKYLSSTVVDRQEQDLIRKFAYETRYTYAGLCTSNALAEIVARQFDESIHRVFLDNGLIFYDRYVDDCILIFNQHISQNDVDAKVQEIIQRVFFDHDNPIKVKCKTRLNQSKSRYISRRAIKANMQRIHSFDYLGYAFFLSGKQGREFKVTIQYGITQDKQQKYRDRIDEIIEAYVNPKSPDYNNEVLLKHRITAFTSRTVYLGRRYSSTVWKVKGFISNYGQLRYMLHTDSIEASTKAYLEDMVEDAFTRIGIALPYFIAGSKGHRGYSLFHNMETNKSLLLVDHVGYDYRALSNLCAEVGIEERPNGRKRSYGELVRLYLIKIKVGY